MIKYLLLMLAICVLSEQDSYAKSRGSVFLYATETTLVGEPSSESSRDVSLFTGGISFREKTGFGIGWYYSTEYNSAKVTKAGFGVDADKDVKFDTIGIGVQIGYLLPSDTEFSLGLGNKVVKVSQDSTSTSLGVMDYRLGVSQTIFKSLSTSVFVSRTGEMTMRTPQGSNAAKITSFGVGLGYTPTVDD
jgi:hypothetical protein